MVQIEFQLLRLAIARVNGILHGGSDRSCGVEIRPSRQGLQGCRHDMVRSSDCRRSAPMDTKSEANPPADPSDFEDDRVAKRRDHENPVHGVRVHAASAGSVAVNCLASSSCTLFATGVNEDWGRADNGAFGDPACRFRIRARCRIGQCRMRSAVLRLRVGRYICPAGIPKRLRSGAWWQRETAAARGRDQDNPASGCVRSMCQYSRLRIGVPC